MFEWISVRSCSFSERRVIGLRSKCATEGWFNQSVKKHGRSVTSGWALAPSECPRNPAPLLSGIKSSRRQSCSERCTRYAAGTKGGSHRNDG